LCRKKRSYIQELREFEQKLENLTTAKRSSETSRRVTEKVIAVSSSDVEEEYAAISLEIASLSYCND